MKQSNPCYKFEMVRNLYDIYNTKYSKHVDK